MTQTKLENLVKSPVFADAVREKIGNAVKFMPVSFQQSFSNQQVGTISVPSYKYIGDADLKPEGVALDPVLLTQASEPLTIVTVGKAVEITDEAFRGGVGNPIDEAQDQLVASVANAIDNAIATALVSSTLSKTVTGLDATGFFNAQSMFGEDQDGDKTLFVNPTDAIAVQTDKAFIGGKFYGADIVITNKVTAGTAYLVKNGGTGVYLAQDIEVEVDRDILAKTTVLAGSAMFAAHVRDESKVVKITITPAP